MLIPGRLRSRLIFCLMSLMAQGAHRGRPVAAAPCTPACRERLSDVEAVTPAVSATMVNKLTAVRTDRRPGKALATARHKRGTALAVLAQRRRRHPAEMPLCYPLFLRFLRRDGRGGVPRFLRHHHRRLWLHHKVRRHYLHPELVEHINNAAVQRVTALG